MLLGSRLGLTRSARSHRGSSSFRSAFHHSCDPRWLTEAAIRRASESGTIRPKMVAINSTVESATGTVSDSGSQEGSAGGAAGCAAGCAAAGWDSAAATGTASGARSRGSSLRCLFDIAAFFRLNNARKNASTIRQNFAESRVNPNHGWMRLKCLPKMK